MAYIDNYGNLVTYEDSYSLELYHHGIRGQRWGRKNGPPYPLDAADHSAAEKKAGWRKSLASAARGAASGAVAAVRGTAKGAVKTAKTAKKILINLDKYPKFLMSEKDINDRVERLRQLDTLKRARGKMTAEDKLNQKLKQKDAMREVVKQSLSQLIPSICKDLIIQKIKDTNAYKLEVKKKRALDKVELEAQAKKDIYEDARAMDKSAAESLKAARWKLSELGDEKIAPRKDSKGSNKNGRNGFNLDNEVEKDIYNAEKKKGLSPTEAAERARNRDDSNLKKSQSSAVDDITSRTSSSKSGSVKAAFGTRTSELNARIDRINREESTSKGQQTKAEKKEYAVRQFEKIKDKFPDATLNKTTLKVKLNKNSTDEGFDLGDVFSILKTKKG